MAQDKLTDKQEAFAQGIAAGKTASDAYRDAYNCDGWQDKTVWVKASQLRSNDKVVVRIGELLSQNERRNIITREGIMTDLENVKHKVLQAMERPVKDADGNIVGSSIDPALSRVLLQALDQEAKMIGAYEQKINARVSSQTIEDYLKTLDDD